MYVQFYHWNELLLVTVGLTEKKKLLIILSKTETNRFFADQVVLAQRLKASYLPYHFEKHILQV